MKKSLLNLTSLSLTISTLLLLVLAGQAQVRVPFTQRTSAFTPTQTIYSIHGDFTMIGNTNMTLVTYSNTEPNSNNDMKKVDTDGISSTNNSSAATLVFSNENGANPACSEVLFAGLYWTARTNSTPTELQKRTIKFRGPGESNYTTYIATTTDIRYPGDNSMYAGFVEVTEKVQALGAGQYWAADMALTTGDGGSTGYYGGWGMVVVYGNSKMQKRDITIFDGYAFMDGNQDLSFELPVSGFNSTLSGPVNMKLGMMAGEGDVSISGDQFEIQKLGSTNWQLLNHGGNSTTNFFNSSIFTGGNTRNPNILNNTGMDISMFTIPNPSNSVIANGQTNTKFRYSSTQDTYIIHSICMAVDAYEPAIEGFLSTVSVNGVPTSSSTLTVLPDDEITYNVKIRNRGNEPVNNARLEIPLPYSAVTYLGSTVNAYAPASSSTLPIIDVLASANGSLVWDFGTLPVPANADDVLGEITFTLQVSEDCELFRNFNCSAPTVEIDGTISGVGANTGIAVEDQRFYVGFSATDGCSTEPINGPFTININSADWVTANCPAGDGVRDFAYCNRTTPISITEVSGFYPAGTRFFNVAGTIEYTIANPFPNVAGPTTYKAQLPGGGCQLTFTIAVTTITSVPSVAAGTLEYCQNSPAVALTATPSNPSYALYYYAPSNGATQPSIIPATDVVGTFTYQVAEGPSSTCISSNRANIPVTILELPIITATPEQPLCFGQTGSVVLASSGGTGALSYSAINPATSGLTAGSYTYSVSDSKNCRATATALINAAPDQPAQPEIECWENASWNSTTCQWDVTGEQPAQPTIECWENATFNNESCQWDVTGEQPAQPTIECWENATFNNESCQWDVTGEQPEQPTIECWENATFNNESCQWYVTGEQPAQPTIECWENATFNNESCQWDVTGEQPAQPTIECWENATFNNESCQWDVTGEQPEQPSIECWENATFNNESCQWDVTGEQPAQPGIECWENATFNNESCQWDVTGEQPAQPSIECWENATFNNESCQWDVTGEQPAQPSIECWENATFNNSTCSWDVTGEQPAQPTIECWENATFNNATCSWDVTGEQPAQPSIECWENATFNNESCQWDVTGEQPEQPSIECWENATFNNESCQWDVTGEQPAQPTIDCWENATFNNESCQWDVTGEQPAQPSIECWENATFNNETCSWDVTGEQPAQPSVECWENATFNNATCSWDVTGEQPAQPSIECWENATFNNATCSWDVTGEQPAQPTIECWENATFNNATCSWDVTGEQPAQPSIECWENATFNNESCQWDVTGEQPAQPSIECWENATFNNESCQWDVTGEQPAQPSIECWENATFNNSTCSWDVTGEQPAQPSIECWENATFNNESCQWDVTGEQPEQPELACYEIASFNNETCVWDITVEDLTIPVISAAGDNMTIECPATPEFTAPTAEDACGEVTVVEVSDITTEGSCAGTYSRTITWKAVDNFGNESSTVSQTITVTDTTAPIIEALSNSAVSCGDAVNFEQATATDNCDSDVSLTFEDEIVSLGGCDYTTYSKGGWGSPSISTPGQYRDNNFEGAFPSGLTVGCEVGSFTFTSAQAIEDFIPSGGGAAVLPAGNIVNPSADVFSNNFADQLMAAVMNTTFDAYDEAFGGSDVNLGDLTFASGTFAGMTANQVIAIANDAIGGCGSTYSNVELSSAMEAINLSFHEGTVNSGVLLCGSDENECSYTTVRTWTASDDCGNTSTATQTLVVSDNIAPTISEAGDNATIECPAIPVFTAPTASDNCSTADVIVVNDVATEGTCSGTYSRTISWKAVDACGNESDVVSQTINVVDQTSPSVVTPVADQFVQCGGDIAYNTPVFSDLCDASLSITSEIDTIVLPQGIVITRTFTATDDCGNSVSDESLIVIAIENDPILLNLPESNIQVSCDNIPETSIVIGEDVCGNELVVNFNEEVSGDNCNRVITRSWNAVDSFGNESSFTQTITVVDTTPPAVDTYSMEITVHCDEVGGIPALTATDACNDVQVDFTDILYSGGCPGTIERNYTFTDACGNVAEATQFITIIDTIAPLFTFIPEPRFFACGDSYTEPATAQASDICDSELTINFTSTVTSSECLQQQLVVNTWTAIDDCLNETSVTVIDVITICPEVEEVIACDQYEWFGSVYTESGSYEHTENENECEIVYALNLTINQSENTSFDATSCVSYNWSGTTYTASGDYTRTFENTAGCDSTVTLHLTINQPSSAQVSATSCSSYTWNGQTYTTSGVYNFVTTNAAGCDSTVTLTLTINTPSVAATSISTNPGSTILPGGSVMLTVNGGSLGTGASWKWYSGSCGGTLVGTGTSITVSPSATTTYFVRAEGTCNNTVCVSRTINVSLPCGPQTLVSNAPNNTVCYGTATTLTVGGTLQSGGSWKWYKNSCGGICIGTGTNLTVLPTSTTTYYVRSEGGSCGITSCMSITIHVNSLPSRPSYITGLTTGLCNRTGVTYCTPSVMGATSYQWTVPTGATIVSGQGTTCITVNFSGSLGSNSLCGYSAICVRAVNSCGLSQARCVNLYTAPSGFATLTGLSYATQGNTTTYSISSVNGATTYNWSVPAGWSILNGQGTNTITVLVGHNSGFVRVTPSNACASGSIRMKYVIVNCPGFRDNTLTNAETPDAVLYPNPANESFTIESGDALPTFVEVMDISGKIVYNGTGVRQVNTQQLTTGIYLVRIYFHDEIQTKRLEILH